MLSDEEIFALLPKEEDELAFARAVERAAYEAAIKACMEERFDADATRSNEDEAYNLAFVHCAEAIRSLMKEQTK